MRSSRDIERARELAQAIVEVAAGNGLPTTALLTDMNQVLGRTAGNAVEVRESIDHLTGAASDERLREVTLALSAELLVLGGSTPTSPTPARRRSTRLTAARPPSASARWWPSSAAHRELLDAPGPHPARGAGRRAGRAAARPGVVTAIDVRALGIADHQLSAAAAPARPTSSTTASG